MQRQERGGEAMRLQTEYCSDEERSDQIVSNYAKKKNSPQKVAADHGSSDGGIRACFFR